MSVLSSLIRYDYAGFAPVRFLRSAFVMLTKLISREGSSRRLDIHVLCYGVGSLQYFEVL